LARITPGEDAPFIGCVFRPRRPVAGLTALRERAFEFVEEARSLDLELDLTAARAAMGRVLDRVRDALADQATAERMATTVALIQRARWLGLDVALVAKSAR
jgi:hypothetical protein